MAQSSLVIGWLFMALVVATGLTKAQEAPADATGVVEPEKQHVFQPNPTGSVGDSDAVVHSQLRQFWDAQTKQAMNANIANEEQRRREQGWDQDGGNVLDAMREIRDKAKDGSDVDAGELHRQASAARAKISRKSEPGSPNSLTRVKQEEADEAKNARGDVLHNNERARAFLEAVKNKQELEETGKVEKEQERVENLRGSGNFMRTRP